MIDIEEHKLLEKFPNWKVVRNSPTEMELVSSEKSNGVIDVIDFLYTTVPDMKWNFKIQENSLIVGRKAAAKYGRMYTSGCFDIFHYGHLNILVKSKEICDYLIVGVSTDELIEKEKGRKPIIPFEERMKVVQSIGLVDQVIAQTDKDKQKIVDTYGIDAISVGSDWKGRYPKVSCAMEYFPYTENVSSTILKKALRLNAE